MTILLTSKCITIDVTGSNIQCITCNNHNHNLCGEKRSIFGAYISVPPLSPLSICFQSHDLFVHKSLPTISLLLSHTKSPQYHSELKNFGKYPTSSPFSISHDVLVCFSVLVCTYNSLFSAFLLYWLWVNNKSSSCPHELFCCGLKSYLKKSAAVFAPNIQNPHDKVAEILSQVKTNITNPSQDMSTSITVNAKTNKKQKKIQIVSSTLPARQRSPKQLSRRWGWRISRQRHFSLRGSCEHWSHWTVAWGQTC